VCTIFVLCVPPFRESTYIIRISANYRKRSDVVTETLGIEGVDEGAAEVRSGRISSGTGVGAASADTSVTAR
jgi:hypothetical protein